MFYLQVDDKLKSSISFVLNAVIILCIFLIYKDEALSEHSPIKSDEDVILFPSLARQDSKLSNDWSVSLHGWIFEPEHDSIRRKILLSSLCRALRLLDDECNTEIFKQRARYFLVDNERGKKIQFSLGAYSSISEPSGKEGHFRAEFKIEEDKLFPNGNHYKPFNEIKVYASDRNFTGELIAVPPKGISVISDIDDTIKFSNVTDKNELLRNTFLRDFKEAPGMVTLYKSLESKNISFHYVSASPWQLYMPIRQFMNQAGFPNGTFHLKEFRWKDSRFFDLFQSPHSFKVPIITSLIKQLPEQRFILIGDSGEQDPEIYGKIVKDFPDRDIRILIRELDSNSFTKDRLLNSFKNVPENRWKVLNEDRISSFGEIKEDLTQFVFN